MGETEYQRATRISARDYARAAHADCYGPGTIDMGALTTHFNAGYAAGHAALLAQCEELQTRIDRALAEHGHAGNCRSHWAVGWPSREFRDCNCWRAALTSQLTNGD